MIDLSKKELTLLMLELTAVNALLTQPVNIAIEQLIENREKYEKPLTSLYEKLTFEARSLNISKMEDSD